MQVFKDNNEMLAYIRHKTVEIKHKAVKVEDIKKKEESKEEPKKKKSKKKEK